MGVPGFTTFIDQNPDLLTDFQLHHSRVVIDGNNMLHFLDSIFSLDPRYNGDYDTFAGCVRRFVKSFRECGLQPFVVIDGAYDLDDRKIKTTKERAAGRVRSCLLVSQTGRGRLLPILAPDVFLAVLDELGVEHVTSDFEADREIAALANHWQCPVISNDSDFFVYDLKVGVVILDYLNFAVKKKMTTDGAVDYKYLACQMYRLDTLTKKFPGMIREMVPLFATLIGNDITDSSLFEDFFSSVKLPGQSPSSGQDSKRYNKLYKLFSWLDSFESLGEATDRVLGAIKKEKRKHVKEILNRSINTYLDLRTYLHDYHSSGCEIRTNLETYDKREFPAWFVSDIRNGLVSPLSLNAAVSHKVFMKCQVEIVAEPSSYLCASPIREIVYGVLCGRLDDSDIDGNVEEYGREHKEIKKWRLCGVQTLGTHCQVPALAQVSDMPLDERRDFFLQVLHTPPQVFMETFRELQLVFSVIFYWIQNAEPKVSSHQLSALLLSILKLTILDRYQYLRKSKKSPSNGEVDNSSFMGHVQENCSEADVEFALDKLKRFIEPPTHSRSVIFDANIVHGYAQFQTCFQAASCLNQVLQHPLINTSPASIFNGTFTYNLCQDLKRRKNPQLYLQEILGNHCYLAEWYQNAYNCLSYVVIEDCLLKSSPKAVPAYKPEKHSRKGKKKKHKR